jgi:curli biogenesis system outer membrane secretion channel CsgG
MQFLPLLFVSTLVLSGCLGNPVQMGSTSAKTTATGAAGGANSANANASLERCNKPLGTLGLLEETHSDWYRTMNRYGVNSTVPILRLLAQQSNCFVVVERGQGFKTMTRERDLQNSGELREHSNFNKGQMVSADYGLTPTLIFQANDTGGIGGAGLVGALVGAAMKSKEAQSILTLVDNRSGVQVAVAEGSAKARDIGGLLGVFGGGAGGILSGYTKTPEGKVVVGAMTDAFNQLVRVVKNYRPQESSGPQGHGTGGSLKVN